MAKLQSKRIVLIWIRESQFSQCQALENTTRIVTALKVNVQEMTCTDI